VWAASVAGTLVAGAGVASAQCPNDNIVVFEYSGAVEAWTVPAGVERITLRLRGGDGGGAYSSADPTYLQRGQRALWVEGTFDVSPGQELSVLVGGRGQDSPEDRAGGGGGGGTFVVAELPGGGREPMLVAGGGGGRGRDSFVESARWSATGMNSRPGEDGQGGGSPGTAGGGGGFYGGGEGIGGGAAFTAGGAGGQGSGMRAGGFGGGGAGGAAGGGGGGFDGGGGGGSEVFAPNVTYVYSGGNGGSFVSEDGLLARWEEADPYVGESDGVAYVCWSDPPCTVAEDEAGNAVVTCGDTSVTIEAGADGEDGVDGVDGAPGADGKDGVDGAPGVDGKDGAPGRDGLDGRDGRDGANACAGGGPGAAASLALVALVLARRARRAR